MRTLVRFICVYQCLNLRCQEAADGCGPLSRKHLGFLYDQWAEAHGKILFSGWRHTPGSPQENSATRILRALLLVCRGPMERACSDNAEFPLQLLEGDSFGFWVDKQNNEKLKRRHDRKEGEGESP